jgi:hypothetical protein
MTGVSETRKQATPGQLLGNCRPGVVSRFVDLTPRETTVTAR